jgi:hypothetical protein
MPLHDTVARGVSGLRDVRWAIAVAVAIGWSVARRIAVFRCLLVTVAVAIGMAVAAAVAVTVIVAIGAMVAVGVMTVAAVAINLMAVAVGRRAGLCCTSRRRHAKKYQNSKDGFHEDIPSGSWVVSGGGEASASFSRLGRLR